MTSQAGQQIIKIHKLPNISRIKGNQAMKFGQLIRYSTRNIFLRNHAEKELVKFKASLGFLKKFYLR